MSSSTDDDGAADRTGADRTDEKQCRICLDGEDPSLGRLIRPCLCKGSISFVHVKCLQQWRNVSSNSSAFFSCPQCHYRYHFARTKVVGIATNPIAIAAISSTLFTLIVLASSFLTTSFLSTFEEPTYYTSDYYVFTPFWTNPFDVARELVRAALRIIQEESGGIVDPDFFMSKVSSATEGTAPDFSPPATPGLLRRFIRRFVLGLPIVGAGSLVQMLLSLPLLGPVHWIARFRGGRNRRDSRSRDAAAIVIVVLLVVGAVRAVYQVYRLTESIAKRVLLRAEDSILEVSS